MYDGAFLADARYLRIDGHEMLQMRKGWLLSQKYITMSQYKVEKSQLEKSRSYKDLVRQNMKLNAELRKLGGKMFEKKPDYTRKVTTISNDKKSEGSIHDHGNQQLKQLQAKIALSKVQGLTPTLSQSEIQSARARLGKGDLPSPILFKNERHPRNPVVDSLNEKLLYQNQSLTPSMSKNNSKRRLLELAEASQKDEVNEDQSPQSLYERKIQYKAFTPPSLSTGDWYNIPHKSHEGLLEWIRENVVGFNTSYVSPVQLEVQTVYVDHTATNRPFKTVEIMVEYAKLFGANPHTQFSRFGSTFFSILEYSTEMMHYARDSLLRSFSAKGEDFVVLPTGNGSTGAIEKAVRILKNLEEHDKWEQPTIFLTPYQHHSNILPWVQFYEKIQLLVHDDFGTLQLDKIVEELRECPAQNIIVTVSAASNVTSKITDLYGLNTVIKILRKEGDKRIIFAADCAAFCCHHDLDLSVYDELDLAFISPHKNLGGAESCGILVARKSLIDQAKPTFPGGGTVRFVKGYKKEDVMYEVDVFARQIAGTPAFYGFYRAALSFQLLKNAIGYDFIHLRQKRNTEIFFSMIEKANAQMQAEGQSMVIQLYGEKNLDTRANVITFNFEYGRMKFIQHSFASLLFTDIFGIQVRSGCFCAGPYGIQLLKITQDIVDTIQEQVEAGIMINKPGYLRLDLTFYLQEYEIEYIANAVILIAKYWQNLQKLYTVCKDGEVILLPSIAKKQDAEPYSLGKFVEAYDKIRIQGTNNKQKLKNRRETLSRQLKMGEYIAKNPVDFIKKIKSGKKPDI